MSEAWKHVDQGMEVTLTYNVDSIPEAKVKTFKLCFNHQEVYTFRLRFLMREEFRYLHRMKFQLEKLSLGKS